MKNILILKIYLLPLLFGCLFSKAQRIDTAISKLNREYKQEKLYLHFDRSIYNPGETIWFKAYLFTGSTPSLLSKTVYAELLDDKGKVLERKVAPIIMSSAATAFDLPANLSGGVVYIRAYTKWMLNFDSSFLYTKAIPIATIKKYSKEISSNFSLHFFPEGGDIIQNITSRVAFKATDNMGMPINISGEITDGKGIKLISFKSVHDGMGFFELLPKSGETYKALWKDDKGISHETLLPVAKQNGVVLEVNNNSIQIEFKISHAADVPPPYPFVYVVAQINQQLLYRAKANLGKTNTVAGIIPSDKFPSGIVQITLFTPDEKPIAERITFINVASGGFITDITATLKDLGKRKKNIIQLDLPDTIPANLSVAITDAYLDPVQHNDNIFSNILLTSDIKGYVHQPAYYFSSDADSVADHLDLVMMTNGWRRFNWDKVLAGQFPKFTYLPENYLVINGKISGLNKNVLATKEVNTVIVMKDQKKEYLNTKILTDGYFVFPEMIFYDTAKIFYQLNNDKKKVLTQSAKFDIKNNFLRNTLQVKPDGNSLLTITKPDSSIFLKNIEVYKNQVNAEELSKTKTLKEVVVTVKQKTKEEKMDDEYTSGAFSGGNSRTLLPDDDPAFLSSQSLIDYLQGRVAGLQVDPNVTEDAISRRGQTTALFINEIPQQTISMTTGKLAEDATYLLGIPMSDVAMVKIFDPPFIVASGGGRGGAVAVYLKKGVSLNNVKGLDYVNIPGYSAVKEFYSPDYTKVDQTLNADYRKTIYWNPFVFTNKTNQHITIPFYNNDITKRVKIIIEGCNEDGKLTRIEKVLE